MYNKNIKLFLIFYLFCFSIHAEVSDEILDELSIQDIFELPMIDIATGYAVPLESAPAVATLITAEDIERMGAETLDEVLNTVPGLHVIPSFFSRTDPIHSIRGIYTGFNPQVLFMLNGVRLTSPHTGSLVPNYRVNIKNISRVEIVRGPGSAIYGADAFAGVINIITKNAQELKRTAHIGIRLGSDQLKNSWWQYGTTFNEGTPKIDDWHLATLMEYAQRDTDRSRQVKHDLQTTLDGLFSTQASLAPGYIDRHYHALTYGMQLYNNHWVFRLNGTKQVDNGLGAGIAQALDNKGSEDLEEIIASLEYKNKTLFQNWSINSQFSYHYTNDKASFVLFPPNSTLLIGQSGNLDFNSGVPVTFNKGLIGKPGGKSKTPQLELTSLYSGFKYHTLRFNIGIRHESQIATNKANFGPSILDNPIPFSIVDGTLTSTTGTPFNYVKDASRTVQFTSFQDIWDITANWSFTSGIRYDHYSDFGKTINPRFALIWTNGLMTAKLLHGQAFRSPSFAELYNINNPVAIGNPNLDPETIKTTELAFAWHPSWDLNASANLYYYETKDMIAFIPDPDPIKNINVAQNTNNLEGKGIELAVDWNISKQWHINANYAYQSTINTKTGQQQPYVAKQFSTLSADYLFHPQWKITTQLDWVADRIREEDDQRNPIKDYYLMNLSLLYQTPDKHWKGSAVIKNIFDKKAYEPSDGKIPEDYPLGGRALFFSIEYIH